MAFLVLIRHTSSLFNEKGLWTGLTDVELSNKGREEAKECAEFLKDISFDFIYTSALKRTIQTAEIIKHTLASPAQEIPTQAFNERNYGDFTGQNKWDVEKKIGKEEFQKMRRSYDYPIPNGETLKDVYQRVVPFYEKEMLPLLARGKNMLVVAHGNSLRALIKYLESISDSEISKTELATGEAYVYTIDERGKVINKEIRNHRENLV
jgi:2,3-bisphosphoglycerate-dependent phosphoglycerate mutase